MGHRPATVSPAREDPIDEQRLLEQVVAQTPTAIAVVLGPHHEFRYFNDAYLALVPAGRVEVGRTVAQALPEAVEAGVPLLDRAFAGETVRLDPLPLPFSGPESFGGHRYYRGVFAPLLQGDRPIGVLITGTDITHDVRRRQDLEAELARERDLAEQLQESEARFRALFSAIDEGYCLCEMVLDPDGRPVDYRFLEANPQFEAMTGLHGAVGRTAFELVPGLEPRWVETYGRVALGGEPIRFQQGSEAMGRSFDVFATPVEPRGRFALVFNDITQREVADGSGARPRPPSGGRACRPRC
jgi:PAS domain-containing protein